MNVQPSGRTPAEGDPAHPDILVVVMDCVRASDFVGGADFAGHMPFLQSLRGRAIGFPRAASVAPWTLPSHASLFTGLYPWEHGCHGKGSLRLSAKVPRLPALLAEKGYRTLSVSANPVISPNYGLTTGFDGAIWGDWWEQGWRTLPEAPHHADRATLSDPSLEPVLSRRDRMGRLIKTAAQRLPAALASSNSVMQKIADGRRKGVGTMNPWLEPAVEAWLARQPRDAPTFCFVNYIDAHEPYLADLLDDGSLAEWWRCMRIPQDSWALMAKADPLSREDLGRLHHMYVESIRALDRRLERLLQIYESSGRWSNTALILTSDHGQAFGDHGMIWHGIRTDEAQLRVPLWLRLPGDQLGGTKGTGWASPMDVTPTALDLAGITDAGPFSGHSLRGLIEGDRPFPLMAAGDGTEWNQPLAQHLHPARFAEINRFSIAAYLGTRKVVVSVPDSEVRAFDVEKDPAEERPLEPEEQARLEWLIEASRSAGRELLHPSGAVESADVEERLRSWGYI
ncbi:MAG: sulfatase [Thermoplasmata archaeon]